MIASALLRRAAAVAVAGTLTAAAGAGGLPPPEAYEQARREAAYHVQMRIERVGGLPWHRDHGACEVRGRVVEVFRGDLEEGDELTLKVDCAKPRARLPDGPALWTSWRALEEARFVEAYLDETRAVASWQTMLLSEKSEQPACPVELEGPC